ncbi:TetR/AcrR family transcriptional regulator [Paludicola sp. MB14-C6]|uniref:TetR/AcrR family transcriptional regulator n=1 Tax=Paludihabitans sp. MB14-C6 TaxID=3070656 RepID=UPI0027DD531D|nr:TetR/AcrR family transcriptional regulator [Paludicola sp. MB14-C6]WMJ22856.1 TetR/AcrR family transcriptional regulator [Paludicola sp. MB14-C6]
MATVLNANIKDKILQSATQLLQENSFNDISLASIAKNAQISKGTLYYYYNSKDDILFDITEKYLETLEKALVDWIENKDKDTSLPRIIKYVLEFGCAENFGNLRLYLVGAAVSGNEPLRQKYVEKYSQFKTRLTQEIAIRSKNDDADYIVWLLLTVMDGVLIQNQLHNADFNKDDFIKKTVELIQEKHKKS